MPVPPYDILCRFVRPADWSERENRPRPGAFKQAALSVWHTGQLQMMRVDLDELRIEHLSGCGQAHHSALDYQELAAQASQTDGIPFQVQVEWRPNDDCVNEPWRRWAAAHVQVEATVGPVNFLAQFRRLLAAKTRHAVPPD